jgi:hypothetical protein
MQRVEHTHYALVKPEVRVLVEIGSAHLLDVAHRVVSQPHRACGEAKRMVESVAREENLTNPPLVGEQAFFALSEQPLVKPISCALAGRAYTILLGDKEHMPYRDGGDLVARALHATTVEDLEPSLPCPRIIVRQLDDLSLDHLLLAITKLACKQTREERDCREDLAGGLKFIHQCGAMPVLLDNEQDVVIWYNLVALSVDVRLMVWGVRGSFLGTALAFICILLISTRLISVLPLVFQLLVGQLVIGWPVGGWRLVGHVVWWTREQMWMLRGEVRWWLSEARQQGEGRALSSGRDVRKEQILGALIHGECFLSVG